MDKIEPILKQFKMSNDEEIVCEIISFPDDEENDVIVRKVLKISSVDNYLSGSKYYSLRPWMSFYDNINLLYVLNPFHIVAEIEPSDDLKSLYFETLEMIDEDLKEGRHKMSRQKVKESSAKEAAEEIMRNNAELLSSLDNDSDFTSNIVKFSKPKGTVH